MITLLDRKTLIVLFVLCFCQQSLSQMFSPSVTIKGKTAQNIYQALQITEKREIESGRSILSKNGTNISCEKETDISHYICFFPHGDLVFDESQGYFTIRDGSAQELYESLNLKEKLLSGLYAKTIDDISACYWIPLSNREENYMCELTSTSFKAL